MQHLIDVRNQLDRYAAPNKVDWHLACINNRWTKRALASAGFGYPAPQNEQVGFERWKPIFSVAEMGGSHSAAQAAEFVENEKELRKQRTKDIESGAATTSNTAISDDNKDPITTSAALNSGSPHSSSGTDLGRTLSHSKAYNKGASGKVAVVHGLNRPLFHVDLTSALQSAVTNAETREQEQVKKGVGTEGEVWK